MEKKLKKRLRRNTSYATTRERRIFDDILSGSLVSENLIKTITPSQLLSRNKLVKIKIKNSSGTLSRFNGKFMTMAKAEKLIRKYWNSDEWRFRYATLCFIDALPKNESKKFLPMLAILTQDFEVRTVANSLWKKLNKNISVRKFFSSLDKKALRFFKKFIEKNWDSENPRLRYISASLIGLLPEEEALHFLPQLAILAFDGKSIISMAARNSWNSIIIDKRPEEFISSLELGSRELRIIVDFVAKNFNANTWELSLTAKQVSSLL